MCALDESCPSNSVGFYRTPGLSGHGRGTLDIFTEINYCKYCERSLISDRFVPGWAAVTVLGAREVELRAQFSIVRYVLARYE